MFIGGGLLPFASPAGAAASHRPTSRLEGGGTSPSAPGASTEAGATGSASARSATRADGAWGRGAARRVFEVKVLLCFLPKPLHALLIPCLLALAESCAPFSQQGLAPRCLAWQFDRRWLGARDLAGLRMGLVTEVRLGLALTGQPSGWCGRPVRNLRLLMQAARIGQIAAALAAHPAALPLTDELYHALAILQRE